MATNANADEIGTNRAENNRLPEVLTKQWVRNRTNEIITDTLRNGSETLVESPPAGGKTTELFAAVEDTEEPISYLTERQDLYEQADELARDHGLKPKVLPSPYRSCPTFDGDHGDKWRNRVTSLYGPNVGGAALHEVMDLPCTDDGACPYQSAWNFEPDEFEVLVGHYVHAHVPAVVENRTIVIDEFAGEATMHTFENPEPVVSSYLRERSGLPFDDWGDFVDNRYERRSDAVHWFVENYREKNPEPREIVDDDTDDVHGLAGDLLLGLLFAEDLGNGFRTTEKTVAKRDSRGWRRTPLRDVKLRRRISPSCVWNTEKNVAHLLTTPSFKNANGVVALDGTPTKRMWDTAFGVSFDHERVVPGERMTDYLTDALAVHVHQYGAHDDDKAGTRPYSSGNHLYDETDERVLFGAKEHFGTEPDVITTKAAIEQYEEGGILDRAGEYRNFASVKSSNDFRDSTVGVVLGSPHPGDEVFQRWGAFMGFAIEGSGKGVNRSYGGRVGNEIYHHFVHDQVLQSILRFGRDGQEAHVITTSMATPSWVEPEELELPWFAESERDVVDYLRDSDGATQKEIVEETGLAKSIVSETLTGLEGQDYIGLDGTDGEGNLRRVWKGMA